MVADVDVTSPALTDGVVGYLYARLVVLVDLHRELELDLDSHRQQDLVRP